MAYDAQKDVLVHAFPKFQTADGHIEIGVYKYNGAAPKIRMHAVTVSKSTGKEYRNSIGNMTRAQFELFVGLSPEILNKL
jgi:hypothetical protein